MKGTLSQCSFMLSISVLMRFQREEKEIKWRGKMALKRKIRWCNLSSNALLHSTLALSPWVPVCAHIPSRDKALVALHTTSTSHSAHISFFRYKANAERLWTPNAIKFCSGDIWICTFFNCLCLDLLSATNLLHMNNVFLTC